MFLILSLFLSLFFLWTCYLLQLVNNCVNIFNTGISVYFVGGNLCWYLDYNIWRCRLSFSFHNFVAALVYRKHANKIWDYIKSQPQYEQPLNRYIQSEYSNRKHIYANMCIFISRNVVNMLFLQRYASVDL